MDEEMATVQDELSIPTEFQLKVIEWANQFIQNPQSNDAIISDITKYVSEVLKSSDVIEEYHKIIEEVIKEKKKILKKLEKEQLEANYKKEKEQLEANFKKEKEILKQQEKLEKQQEKEEKKLEEKLEKEVLKEVEKQQEKIIIEEQVKEKDIGILNIFSPEEYTETNSAYKMECPDCGLQGNRTEGFILFPESDTAYCHSSGKWFKLLEAYALKKKIIRCLDGRETGDKTTKILGGELYTLTLDEFRNEFTTEQYNALIDKLKIKKPIELAGNDRLMSNFCDDVGDIYRTRNVLFFRGESRDVVEIGRYKKINHKGEEYVETGFVPITGNRLITLAEMFIEPWTTIVGLTGKSKIVKKSMTHSMASVCIESPNFQNKLPVISRIFDIQIPILHKDKLTFPKKGYDKRFGSWLPYNAPEIKVGMYTLEEAKMLIDKIFEEFCFADDEDRTHAIAGFITPFLRGLFPKFSTRTPVFIYMANRERAGKDYCAGCSGIIYEGANTEEPAISNDEKGYSNANEEIRKKIMACMIQGKKRFHSANNKGLLNNSIFEGVTTAEIWSDRILGRSHIVTFSNEMDYSLSGNIGIKLTPDLANRGRIINLHLVDEDANARAFKNPKLHEWCLENRSSIISALYKLVENWVEKGMPKGSVPFTSFPIWSNVCGGIMECAGYNNPCKKGKDAIISLDGETEEMKQLYEICYAKRPNQWMEKKEIWELVAGEEIFNDIDMSNQNRSDKTKFGIKIDKYMNRILSKILMKVNNSQVRPDRRKFKFVDENLIRNVKSLGNDENLDKNVTEMVTSVTFGNLSYTGVGFSRNVNNTTNTTNIDISTENRTDMEKLPQVTKVTIPEKNELLGKVGFIDNFCSDKKIKNEISNKSEKENWFVQLAKTTPKVEQISTKIEEPQKLETLEDFTKKYKDFVKKEEMKEQHTKEPKEKSDRQLQFFESPETVNIVEQCTEKQVLEWVNTNPQITYEKLYLELGNGSFKHIHSLIEQNLIKEAGEGWEIIDNEN